VNGPEHYRAAEKALHQAAMLDEYGSTHQVAHLAEAQVHATLALVASTAAAVPAACQSPSWQDALVSDVDRGRQEHPDAERSPF
jgi:hypothetical protein